MKDDSRKSDAPFNNPFSKLADKKSELPEGKPAPVPVKAEPKGPAKAVVRYERKGHGGKEVTMVEQLGLPARDLEKWLKELKQSLGCGGTLHGDALMLQGDQRERLPKLLEKRGVKKISVS